MMSYQLSTDYLGCFRGIDLELVWYRSQGLNISNEQSLHMFYLQINYFASLYYEMFFFNTYERVAVGRKYPCLPLYVHPFGTLVFDLMGMESVSLE